MLTGCCCIIKNYTTLKTKKYSLIYKNRQNENKSWAPKFENDSTSWRGLHPLRRAGCICVCYIRADAIPATSPCTCETPSHWSARTRAGRQGRNRWLDPHGPPGSSNRKHPSKTTKTQRRRRFKLFFTFHCYFKLESKESKELYWHSLVLCLLIWLIWINRLLPHRSNQLW